MEEKQEKQTHLVEFHNDLVNERIGRMSAKELDMFMTICYKLKGKETNQIIIGYDDLKTLSKYKSTSLKRLENDIQKIIDSMIFPVHLRGENSNKIRTTSLFNYFDFDTDRQEVTVEVNHQCSYLFSNITENYTRFELEEFISLKSKYAKRLYKLLKQYRTTGMYITSKEQLYKDLEVPEDLHARDFTKRVLQQAIKECSKYLINLNYKASKKGTGQAIQTYTFTFTKEVIPEPKEKLIEQAKKSFSNTKTKTKQSRPKWQDGDLMNSYDNMDFDEFEKELLQH